MNQPGAGPPALLLAGVGLVATREHQGDERSPVPVYMKACRSVSFRC
jgi:hypothetical protein